jgi:hypothetical protein
LSGEALQVSPSAKTMDDALDVQEAPQSASSQEPDRTPDPSGSSGLKKRWRDGQ